MDERDIALLQESPGEVGRRQAHTSSNGDVVMPQAPHKCPCGSMCLQMRTQDSLHHLFKIIQNVQSDSRAVKQSRCEALLSTRPVQLPGLHTCDR